jgi:hypothetical protein
MACERNPSQHLSSSWEENPTHDQGGPIFPSVCPILSKSELYTFQKQFLDGRAQKIEHDAAWAPPLPGAQKQLQLLSRGHLSLKHQESPGLHEGMLQAIKSMETALLFVALCLLSSCDVQPFLS